MRFAPERYEVDAGVDLGDHMPCTTAVFFLKNDDGSFALVPFRNGRAETMPSKRGVDLGDHKPCRSFRACALCRALLRAREVAVHATVPCPMKPAHAAPPPAPLPKATRGSWPDWTRISPARDSAPPESTC